MSHVDKRPVTLTINGHNHELLVEPRKLLVDALREDCRIDPDDFSICIQQRASGASRVDRRIGLNEILDDTDPHAAAERADNATTHGLADTKWIADREDDIAHLELLAVAKHGG